MVKPAGACQGEDVDASDSFCRGEPRWMSTMSSKDGIGIRTRGTLYIVDVGVDVDVFFLSLKKLRQLTENSVFLAIQC